MSDHITEKSYIVQVLCYVKGQVEYATVPESLLDATINEVKDKFPDLKKIVVYDADTKDVINIIKPW